MWDFVGFVVKYRTSRQNLLYQLNQCKMEAKEALEYIKEILKERTRGLISLSPIESKVFVQIWDGKTYNEMPAFIFKANGKPYSYEYLKEIGTELIDKIRNRLNIQDINKTEFKEEIEIFLNRNVNNQPIQTPNVNLTDIGNYNTPIQTSNVNFTNTDNQNPFVPTTGRIENLEKFLGRDQEIKQIFELLNSASSVAIIGEQGIGKSSLLYAVYQQSINFLKSLRQNVFLDMNNIHNQEDFYFAICEKLDIPENTGYRFTRNLEDKRVLLILDNVGKLNGVGFTRDLRDHLRGLAEGENACLKLVLAANESLKTLFNDSYETSPLADICQQVDIQPWKEKTIRDFIAKRLQPTTIDFTETDIQELIQASGGHPQKLTQLCYDLYKEKTL
ncbi:ATP-binding protein [Dolichospermum sp. LEGE 00240]|uniref:nSTAND1 domain-containing NTPase n=1 Tax=Dolichospermum sp. LEGE 00240 TaxID=1828603 RepID=UPI00187F92C0|nr:ATP-binding protein [Dolichospermum sp. LEGE 00240]MBE9249260.1 ATP-binding protein [Dolichospermum sp. LEGE 00240]